MQNSYSSQISFESQETPEKQEDKDRQTKMENQESLVYAGFWVRFAAYALDSLIVFAGLLIVRLIFVGISLAGGGAVTGTDILFHYSLKDIVLYGLKVLYFIAFTYLTGTTLGKRAMNLQVVSENPDGKLTLLDVVYRETVGRFLCSLPVNIGYIVAGIDSEKRGFHDMLCDTRVVYQKKELQILTLPLSFIMDMLPLNNTIQAIGRVLGPMFTAYALYCTECLQVLFRLMQ